MFKKLIQTVLGCLLVAELALILMIIAQHFGTINIQIPFLSYFIHARTQLIYDLVNWTAHTALILWLFSNITTFYDGNKLPDAFEKNGKIALKAGIIYFMVVSITAKILLDVWMIPFQSLGYLAVYVLNANYLESWGPFKNPLEPKTLLIDWLTENPKDIEEEKF